MADLPDIIHAEITRLSEQGNALAHAGDCDAAVRCFEEEPTKYFAFVKSRLKQPPGGW